MPLIYLCFGRLLFFADLYVQNQIIMCIIHLFEVKLEWAACLNNYMN